ncbi:radical SAM family heme chaperone HemW [uncultured Lacinutrix sp.]|uniref:radical SAM family heme chaperone HemW n=1 Tax=uncultured Lacinutrix sp. TaxID=574032 RepID=UPI002630B33D|nr:radical SAM family heme chaperone HemW [uncultured Lacinutrix sp.]
MSGIYIHIPFCKQACHYCDFHFSTSLRKKDELIDALISEIEIRKNEFESITVETIYFGGGTPSLLTSEEIKRIIDSVYNNYSVSEDPEITLEANPDDLSNERIIELSKSPVNRLSIGIQSFHEKDLKLMNRAHNTQEAIQCLEEATKYFNNISLDLIYGIPNTTNKEWEENIDIALGFGVNHISSYALTVEPKTALASFIEKGVIDNVDDALAQEQFHILVDKLESQNFVHYELSNFGKPGFFSRNNSAYWQGKKYIGIGPSAHSFNGKERGWNVRNNTKYIKAIQNSQVPIETETLTKTDQYNEYVMTGLRTVWGVSIKKVKTDFGITFETYMMQQAQKHITEDLLYIEDNKLKVTKKGKFLSDGIASDLFKINLD